MSKLGDMPAFPVPGLSNLPNGEFIHPSGGMTLRDYYAGLAMQGILSNPNCDGNRPLIVQAAVLNADALCKALEKKSP